MPSARPHKGPARSGPAPWRPAPSQPCPGPSGLCGNFNGLEGDDFKTAGGLVEATGAGFANTWKAQSSCHDKLDWLEDPCSLNIESGEARPRRVHGTPRGTRWPGGAGGRPAGQPVQLLLSAAWLGGVVHGGCPPRVAAEGPGLLANRWVVALAQGLVWGHDTCLPTHQVRAG